MGNEYADVGDIKKKHRAIDRPLTDALFWLRCLQVGIALRDLDLLTIGMAMDIFTESNNDHYDYPYEATQEDIDRFIEG